jgi:hypothetical protein
LQGDRVSLQLGGDIILEHLPSFEIAWHVCLNPIPSFRCVARA